MTQKHTKGPWSVEMDGKWPWDISITPNIVDMRRIAYCTSNKNLEDVRNATAFKYDEREKIAKMVAEQEANARLIAAAPELLEALEDLIDKVTDIRGVDIYFYAGVELEKADAAIAKAKGTAE